MRNCPDCGVPPGEDHESGCDVERCASCGGQRLSCGCYDQPCNLPWTGEWPDVAECRNLGWYAKLVPGKGWMTCQAEDENAVPDLNRFYTQAVWDPYKKSFILNRD